MANNNNIDYKSWLKNFGKNIGKTSISMISSVMPNTTKLTQDVGSSVRDINNYINENKGKISDIVNKATIVTKSDLKTNLSSMSKDFMSGVLGTPDKVKDLEDFLDEDLSFNSLDADLNELKDTNGLSNDAKMNAKASIVSAGYTVDAISELSKTITSTQIATTNATVSGVSNVIVGTVGQLNSTLIGTNNRLDNVNNNMQSIIKFLNENQSKVNIAQINHMTRLENLLLKQSEMYERANRNSLYKLNSKEKIVKNDFDFKEYSNLIKKQFKNSDIMTMMNMLSLTKEMMSMGSSVNMNSSKMIGEQLRNTVFGKMFSRTRTGKKLSSMDKRINNYIMNSLGVLGESDNALSEIFGLKIEPNKKVSMSNYNKGAVSWDGTSKKALEEVIPHYLASIDAGINKKNAEIFDYNKGVFQSQEKILKNLQEEMADIKRTAFSNSLGFIDSLSKDSSNNTRFNEKELENMKKSINKITNKSIFKNGKNKVSSIKNTEKELKTLLSKYSLSDDELNELISTITADTSKARIDYNKSFNNRLSRDTTANSYREILSKYSDNYGDVNLIDSLSALGYDSIPSFLDKTRESINDKNKQAKIKRNKEKFDKQMQMAFDSPAMVKLKSNKYVKNIYDFAENASIIPNKLDRNIASNISGIDSALYNASYGNINNLKDVYNAGKNKYLNTISTNDAKKWMKDKGYHLLSYKIIENNGLFIKAILISEYAIAGMPIEILNSDIYNDIIPTIRPDNVVQVSSNNKVNKVNINRIIEKSENIPTVNSSTILNTNDSNIQEFINSNKQSEKIKDDTFKILNNNTKKRQKQVKQKRIKSNKSSSNDDADDVELLKINNDDTAESAVLKQFLNNTIIESNNISNSIKNKTATIVGNDSTESKDIDKEIKKISEKNFQPKDKKVRNIMKNISFKSILGGGILGSLVSHPILGAVAGATISLSNFKGNINKLLYGKDVVDDNGNIKGHKEGIFGQFNNKFQTEVVSTMKIGTDSYIREMSAYSHVVFDDKLNKLFGTLENKSDIILSNIQKGSSKFINLLLNPIEYLSKSAIGITTATLKNAINLGVFGAKEATKLGLNIAGAVPTVLNTARGLVRNGGLTSEVIKDNLKFKRQGYIENRKLNKEYRNSRFSNLTANLKNNYSKSNSIFGLGNVISTSFKDTFGHTVRNNFNNSYVDNMGDSQEKTALKSRLLKSNANEKYYQEKQLTKAKNKYNKQIQKYAKEDNFNYAELTPEQFKSRLSALKSLSKKSGGDSALDLVKNEEDMNQFVINRAKFIKKKETESEILKDKSDTKGFYQTVSTGLSVLVNHITKGKVNLSDNYSNNKSPSNGKDNITKSDIEDNLKAEIVIKNKLEEDEKNQQHSQSKGGRKDQLDNSASLVEKVIGNPEESKKDDKSLFGKIGDGIKSFFGNPLLVSGAAAALAGVAASIFNSDKVKEYFNNLINGGRTHTDNEGNTVVEPTSSLDVKTNPFNIATRVGVGAYKKHIVKNKHFIKNGAELIGKGFKWAGNGISELFTNKNIAKTVDSVSDSVIQSADSKTVSKFGNMIRSGWKTFRESKFFKDFISTVNKSKVLSSIIKYFDDFIKIVATSKPGKFMTKITAAITQATAETAATIGTGGLFLAATTAIDLSVGYVETEKIFNVKKGEANFKMKAISSLINAILGFGMLGPLVDVANEIYYTVTGFSFKSKFAELVYMAWADEEEEIDLKTAQAEFDEEYKQYISIKGNENLTKQAYNDMTHKGFLATTWDNLTGKGIKSNKPVVFNTPQSHRDGTYIDPKHTNNAGYGTGYQQNDSRWGNIKLGKLPNGRVANMSNAGCGPTALANAANALGKKVTPIDTAKIAKSGGYLANGGATSQLFTQGSSRLGIRSRNINNTSDILNSLQRGNPVIMSGKTIGYGSPYTSAGHLITATGMTKNGNVIVQNPQGGKQLYSVNELTNGLRNAWSMSAGYGEPTEKDMNPSGYSLRTKNGAVYYQQNNSAATGWNKDSDKLARDGSSNSSIGRIGCVLTSAAMAASSLTGKKYDPGLLNKAFWRDSSMPDGSATTDTFKKFDSFTGVNTSMYPGSDPNIENIILSSLKDRKPVMLQGMIPSGSINNGKIPFQQYRYTGPHNILAVGLDKSGRIMWNDPSYPNTDNISRPFSDFKPYLRWARVVSYNGKGINNDFNPSNITTVDGSEKYYNMQEPTTISNPSEENTSGSNIFDIFGKIGKAISTVASDAFMGFMSGKGYNAYKQERLAKENQNYINQNTATIVPSASPMSTDVMNDPTSITTPVGENGTSSLVRYFDRRYIKQLNQNLTKYNPMSDSGMNKYIDKLTSSYPNSPFKGNGKIFNKIGNELGVDPRYIVSHATVESAGGTSPQARSKGNYFGIGAYNNNPSNAYSFNNESLESGIKGGASWIRDNYLNAGQNSLASMLKGKDGHTYATYDDNTPNYAWANVIGQKMSYAEGYGNLQNNAKNNFGITAKKDPANLYNSINSINVGVENRLDKVIELLIAINNNQKMSESQGFGSFQSKNSGDPNKSLTTQKREVNNSLQMVSGGFKNKQSDNDLGRTYLRNIHSQIATGYMK